jgi:hypothetical protein
MWIGRKCRTVLSCAVAATITAAVAAAATPAHAATDAAFSWQLAQLSTDRAGAVAETNYDLAPEHNWSPVLLNACTPVEDGIPIRSYSWSFSDGDPSITTTSCLATWHRPLSEAYTSTQVTLVATPVVGQPASVTHTIRYRDRVIASLGDSAASGEGAPQKGSAALWAARYCGRSGWAASAQAALQIQRLLQDTTVHFWHLACAGATITAADSRPWWDQDHNEPLYFGGMLDPYNGTYGDQTHLPIPAQIDRLQQLQQQTGLTVDRLLITLGANDTHWATVAEDCLNPLHEPTPHQQQVCLQGYAPRVDQSVALLPSHFDALAQALARNPGWQGRVWINEYFDPLDSLSGPQTPFCGGEVFASQYLRNWAIAHVENPLQDDVQKAASRYGWHFVGGIQHAFQGHGVCWLDPNRRWINSATDSLVAQGDVDGTWHANKTGQLHIADIMMQASGLASIGNIADINTWTGSFTAPGQDEVLYYSPTTYRWFIGQRSGLTMTWNPVGNTAGFGQVADGRPFWTGDFTGNGKTDLLMYYPGNATWWLGTITGQSMTWNPVGNTAGFGQVADGRPFWTGDFTGNGKTDLLMYYPGNGTWTSGSLTSQSMQWNESAGTSPN